MGNSKTRMCRAAIILTLGVIAGSGSVRGARNNGSLPSGLDAEFVKRFPGTHIVQLGDLSAYDRKLYRRDHGERCPGLVRVDFYGDGKPT
jgi:hypothetical protein